MDTKFGIVALIDALGIRMATLSDAHRYITTVTQMQNDLLLGQNMLAAGSGTTEMGETLKNICHKVFGDTILLTYDLHAQRALPERAALKNFALIVGNLLRGAFEQGFLFRGAITVGEYVEGKEIVLGPAVSDAAAWYEQSEFSGVIATPKLHTIMECSLTASGGNYGEYWLRYGAPTKRGPQDTFVVNWFHDDIVEDLDRKLWFSKLLRRFEQPPGTESKYTNTRALFEKCLAAHL